MSGGIRGAVAARMRGDDFQGRIFWTEAMRMFDRRPRVERVGIEMSDYRHFDDVVVLYGKNHGRDHDLECHQAKFHVRNNDALTWEAMMSPGWLGVTGLSLMQRVLEANRQHRGRANLYFTTPWTVDINDALSKVLVGGSEQLNVPALFAGGSASKQGRARAKLLEHLGCEEQELREALSRLRIRDRANLERMQSQLDYRLEAHNFVSVGDLAVNPYDELARKIIQEKPTCSTPPSCECCSKRLI